MMFLVAPRVCPAQAKDLKQVVTVSFSGYDDLMQGIAMVGKLAGMPGLPQMLEAQIQQAGVGEALNALDKKRPWVVAIKTDAEGNEFAVQAFLPTSDVKKLIKSLPLPVEPEDAGDGALELKAPDRSIFVKQHGAWAVISDKKALVAEAPEDPAKAAGGMPEKYQLGARVSVKSVPEGLRKKFLDILSFSVQAGMRQMPNESDEQFAVRSKMIQQGMEQMKTMLNDLDALTVGVKLDDATSSAYLEYMLTMLPGSPSAKKMAKSTGAKTQFAGVLVPDAAVTLHAAQQLDSTDIEQIKGNFAVLRANALADLEKQGLPEEQGKLAKQLATDLMDVVEKTLDGGKVDFAASLKLAPKALTFVAGIQIAEGGKLESVVKQLLQQVAKDQPDAAKFFKLNAEEHSGIRFHVLSVPVAMMDPDAAEKLGAMLGENLDVVIGIGDTKLYLAVGRDAAGSLKQAIDRKAEGTALPPVELSVALGPIVRFVASVAEGNEKQTAQMIGKIIEGAPGKDHLKITATPISNGVKVRLEAEEGVLKAAGIVPMMMGGPAMMGRPGAKAKRMPAGNDDQ
jgi:hypothetical protein